MSLKSDVWTYLNGQSGVTNQFGASTAMRIYPQAAPTSAVYPYCTFFTVSEVPEHHLLSAARLTNAVIQFDVWADTDLVASTAADTLRAEFDGYVAGTITPTNVRWISLESRNDDFLGPDDQSEYGTYRVSSDYSFWFVSTVPTF